jgi:glycosyltransferase involved in cell wall biosynthesis
VNIDFAALAVSLRGATAVQRKWKFTARPFIDRTASEMTTDIVPAKVSVAIACFNQGHFLAAAIESVLAQSRPADEVIVIDDGSQDDTATVARRYYPDVTYCWKKNGGLSSARNEALSVATGDRILFLDADDMLLPVAIESCLAAFDREPQPAFVYGGYREVDAHGALLVEMLPDAENDDYTSLLQRNYIAMHGTVMYDIAMLRESGGFDETLHACEDWDVYLRLARTHPFRSYPHLAANYRRHEASMSNDNMRMIGAVRRVLHRQEPFSSESGRQAQREGLEYMTTYYAGLALEQIMELLRRGQVAAALTELAKGVRYDPGFVHRFANRIKPVLKRRLPGRQRAS